MQGFSRRFVLGGVMAGLASPALAEAPAASPRPAARVLAPARVAGTAVAGAEDLVRAASLSGRVGYAVADLRSGEILEARDPGTGLPPASTAKAITSLYALEHLGAGYRFPTRLIATGPVRGGQVQGDLILAGGGDPTLTTDALGDLAARLKAAGVRGVTGRFLVWSGALPYLHAIDETQPEWLGYNPAVAGINLNFNRVNFVWKRGQGGYEVGMDARADRFVPPVYSARIRVVERDLPVYTYAEGGKVEEWTVARAALGKGGSRWLPVRRPDLYAGDVFQTLARAQGVPLPAPERAKGAPQGTALAEAVSEDLSAVLREMMKYSTNMTAEAVGMAASLRRGAGSHLASARAMSEWLNGRAGTAARFVDHSGLGGASRIAPADMVKALRLLGPGARLGALMKEFEFRDDKGRKAARPALRVAAKTGTLNFVSSLAGFLTAPGGRELVFAIMTADVARRDAVPDSQKEKPEGGRAWVTRSRHLQQQLIERWGAVYSA